MFFVVFSLPFLLALDMTKRVFNTSSDGTSIFNLMNKIEQLFSNQKCRMNIEKARYRSLYPGSFVMLSW